MSIKKLLYSFTDQAACKFDDEVVQRQLRYTGMLATVKIRQSGYNYRLTFEVCYNFTFCLFITCSHY